MVDPQHLVCLSLGSNIAPADNLKQALELLRRELTVLAVSRAWRTPAVGSQGPDFLNAAVLVHAPQPASQLKSQVLRDIEARLGRIRGEDKYAPRTIDIDIVVDGERVVDPELWKSRPSCPARGGAAARPGRSHQRADTGSHRRPPASPGRDPPLPRNARMRIKTAFKGWD